MYISWTVTQLSISISSPLSLPIYPSINLAYQGSFPIYVFECVCLYIRFSTNKSIDRECVLKCSNSRAAISKLVLEPTSCAIQNEYALKIIQIYLHKEVGI